MNTGEIQSPLRVNKLFKKKKKIIYQHFSVNCYKRDLSVSTKSKRLITLTYFLHCRFRPVVINHEMSLRSNRPYLGLKAKRPLHGGGDLKKHICQNFHKRLERYVFDNNIF